MRWRGDYDDSVWMIWQRYFGLKPIEEGAIVSRAIKIISTWGESKSKPN